MAARAIWKGVLRFDGPSVPVKLYSAVEDQGIHFRLLHAKDRVPVEQQMVHPGRDEPVPYEEIQKGLEVEPGVFVVLDENELEALEPEPSRDIELLQFVPREEIDHRWYDRPYYLGPDGDAEGYFALAAALAKRPLEGVARWVMRKRSYIGALREEDGYLVLVTLRRPGEVVSLEQLDAPGGRAFDPRELGMAEQLIEALAAPFEPDDYEDDYRRRVMELIEAKGSGKVVRLPKAAAGKPADDDLAAVLRASLEKAKERKSA